MNKPLFPITDQMPYSPKSLRIPRYVLPSLLGRIEKEEAAARIFTLIHEKGEWTGITWREIRQQMMEEHVALEEDTRAMREYNNSLCQYKKMLLLYCVLSVVTLGIFIIFSKKPTEPQKPKRKQHPFTGVDVFGPNHVAEGIHDLIREGLLRMETIGEGDTAEDVLYPTVQLARTLACYASPPN